MTRLRYYLAALLLDLPRYLFALWRSPEGYLAIRNRGERLRGAPDGTGFECEWAWTSELRAPRLLPGLGSKLMRRALAQHPVLGAEGVAEDKPEISFIIGHRGEARLPLLLRTLASLAAQTQSKVECIVVEQDSVPRIADRLPSWVRHVHSPPPETDMPYCRAWSFNVGANSARSDVLVLHDNDMLVPADYARTIKGLLSRGYEAMNLKRFVFYLDEGHSRAVCDGSAALLDRPPESIVQNLEAGGSVVITRKAYARIGGMDESFVGWGGEDNEFWERVQTLKYWPFGSLPLVHLWHSAQPGKGSAENPTLRRFEDLSKLPVEERIRRLNSEQNGGPGGPLGWAAKAGTEGRRI